MAKQLKMDQPKDGPKAAKTGLPCGDKRPGDKAGQTPVTKRNFSLEEIGDMPIALVIYPGCIEGDRVSYSVRGDDRYVLAFGNVEEIALYSIGQPVKLKNAELPRLLKDREFQRNVNRKQAEALDRIKDEMQGTGGIADLTRRQGKQFNGCVYSVNGTRVTPQSILNSYFKNIAFVEGPKGAEDPIQKPAADLKKDDKPIMQNGKPVTVMGGVELVVSAVIVPGREYETIANLAYRL